MNKSPHKQNVIKLNESKLLGHNTQGVVMAGEKPVAIKPTVKQPAAQKK